MFRRRPKGEKRGKSKERRCGRDEDKREAVATETTRGRKERRSGIIGVERATDGKERVVVEGSDGRVWVDGRRRREENEERAISAVDAAAIGERGSLYLSRSVGYLALARAVGLAAGTLPGCLECEINLGFV